MMPNRNIRAKRSVNTSRMKGKPYDSVGNGGLQGMSYESGYWQCGFGCECADVECTSCECWA